MLRVQGLLFGDARQLVPPPTQPLRCGLPDAHRQCLLPQEQLAVCVKLVICRQCVVHFVVIVVEFLCEGGTGVGHDAALLEELVQHNVGVAGGLLDVRIRPLQYFAQGEQHRGAELRLLEHHLLPFELPDEGTDLFELPLHHILFEHLCFDSV